MSLPSPYTDDFWEDNSGDGSLEDLVFFFAGEGLSAPVSSTDDLLDRAGDGSLDLLVLELSSLSINKCIMAELSLTSAADGFDFDLSATITSSS